MDNIAIATHTTVHGHTAAVRDVLQLAADHNLYFKLEKCIFHAPCIDYLEVILEKGVTHMDPVKIAGIKDWPMLSKVKDVHSFLGFCNFYCTFIRGFASIAKPLNTLTKKGQDWEWTTQHQMRSTLLKHELQVTPYWHTRNWTSNSSWKSMHQDSQWGQYCFKRNQT